MTRFRIIRDGIMADPTPARGAVAVTLFVGSASVLRWVLGPLADPVPFVTYFPAIVICTLFAGWQAGLVSIFASATMVNLVFQQNPLKWTGDPRGLGMTLVFALSCLLIVAISQTVRRTFRELTEANRHMDMLNLELRHRMRNTLAIVQALAQQTQRTGADDFASAFGKRLSALANAHDLLWESTRGACDLKSVIVRTCEPFAHRDSFTFEGPDRALPADCCVPLSLAMHELSTNATKHGALSREDGRVRVSWGDAGPDHVLLQWEEVGGPPVAPPQRRGLGTALLESAGQIGAADLQFHPQGLTCTILVPVVGETAGKGALAAG